jgi:hypothetical protein
LDLGEKPGRTLVRFDGFSKSLFQNQPGFGTSSVIRIYKVYHISGCFEKVFARYFLNLAFKNRRN